MFFNEFRYNLLTTLRDRHFIMWLILFPMALGSLFKAAFSDIYENDIKFSPIPTAIVQTQKDDIFKEVIRSVSKGKDALLKVPKKLKNC